MELVAGLVGAVHVGTRSTPRIFPARARGRRRRTRDAESRCGICREGLRRGHVFAGLAVAIPQVLRALPAR